MEKLIGNDIQVNFASQIRKDFLVKVSALKLFIKSNPLPVDKKFSWKNEVDDWFVSKAFDQLEKIEKLWSEETDSSKWIDSRSKLFSFEGLLPNNADHELKIFAREFYATEAAKSFSDNLKISPGITPEFQSSKPPKERKEWRDPEGSIIRRKEKRRDAKGKLKEVEIIYARVRYTDPHGIKREKKRVAKSAADAVQVRRNLQQEILDELNQESKPEKPKLFSEIIDFYQTEYVKPAEYSGSQKVAGLREPLQYVARHLDLFRAEFGKKLAKKITYEDIRRFKQDRLKVPVVIKYFEKVELTEKEKENFGPNKKYKKVAKTKTRPRAVASVNRELERLRRIFNIAAQKGWVDKSPFQSGDALISHASETERVRILTKEEENALYAHCTGKREHLKAILIGALDTCLRKNELFTLTWADVDLPNKRISVQALNAKTLKPRIVPVTKRFHEELVGLKKRGIGTEDGDLVFGIESSAKNAFYSALTAAGISDFRFHDLRGTGITRLLRAGMNATEVMKISGHTQYKTFMRYVKIDDDTISRAAAALDDYLD